MRRTVCIMAAVAALFAGAARAETVRKVIVGQTNVTAVYAVDGNEVAREVFNANGDLVSREGTIPDGEVRQYSDRGKVIGEWSYRNGRKDGMVRRYSEAGKLKTEASYRDGRRDGVSKEYYDNGALREENTYQNGRLNGVTRIYLKDGKPAAEITYKNDARTGPSRSFYEDGRLGEEANYVNGKRDGETRIYFDNAAAKSPEQVLIYDNGTLLRRTIFAPDGRVTGSEDFTQQPSTAAPAPSAK